MVNQMATIESVQNISLDFGVGKRDNDVVKYLFAGRSVGSISYCW